MVKMAQIENIRKMHFREGLSIREISKLTGHHRDTITKYLDMELVAPPRYKLKQLKMPQAAKVYKSMAREAADNNLTYEEFLLGVLEQEVHQRENNRIQRRIRQATFPVVKTLDNFDFIAIPSLNKPRVLALADGEFIKHKENIIMVGNAGVGKTHLAISLLLRHAVKGLELSSILLPGW